MNPKKNNIMLIQNKFYEALKQKEIMYKKLDEINKNNKEDINLEFNYPYYIYQEIKKNENQNKNYQEEKEETDTNEKKGSKNKKIQLIKTNMKYNILYEY
jgi:hypothetical protein